MVSVNGGPKNFFYARTLRVLAPRILQINITIGLICSRACWEKTKTRSLFCHIKVLISQNVFVFFLMYLIRYRLFYFHRRTSNTLLLSPEDHLQHLFGSNSPRAFSTQRKMLFSFCVLSHWLYYKSLYTSLHPVCSPLLFLLVLILCRISSSLLMAWQWEPRTLLFSEVGRISGLGLSSTCCTVRVRRLRVWVSWS